MLGTTFKGPSWQANVNRQGHVLRASSFNHQTNPGSETLGQTEFDEPLPLNPRRLVCQLASACDRCQRGEYFPGKHEPGCPLHPDFGSLEYLMGQPVNQTQSSPDRESPYCCPILDSETTYCPQPGSLIRPRDLYQIEPNSLRRPVYSAPSFPEVVQGPVPSVLAPDGYVIVYGPISGDLQGPRNHQVSQPNPGFFLGENPRSEIDIETRTQFSSPRREDIYWFKSGTPLGLLQQGITWGDGPIED